MRFEDAKRVAEKDHNHCIKNEVIDSMTASVAFACSRSPGSVHDEPEDTFRQRGDQRLVGRSMLIGDKGHRGGESSATMLFIIEDETCRDLSVQRTLSRASSGG